MSSHTARIKTLTVCWTTDVQEDGSARVTLAGYRVDHRTNWVTLDQYAGTIDAPEPYESKGGERWIITRAQFPDGGYYPRITAGEGEEDTLRTIAGERLAIIEARTHYNNTTSGRRI